MGLPILASSHTVECPGDPGLWHQDLDCVFGPDLRFVEVFYFPQDTPSELGPTEIGPGNHLCHHERTEEFEGGVLSDGSAGTIGIHHQSILHRKGASVSRGRRRMLKFNYWHTSPPERYWIVEPDFNPRTTYYGGHNFARYVAHMFFWLCGKGEEFSIIGGQGWPWRTENQIRPSYGYGCIAGYLPDWRRDNSDGYTR